MISIKRPFFVCRGGEIIFCTKNIRLCTNYKKNVRMFLMTFGDVFRNIREESVVEGVEFRRTAIDG